MVILCEDNEFRWLDVIKISYKCTHRYRHATDNPMRS